MDRTELEVQGRLQVRIAKTVMRTKFIMLGNALLVAWLASVVLVTIWYLAYSFGSPGFFSAIGAQPFGMSLAEFQKLNLVGIMVWKLAAHLLLLCPGLGFRICGAAMKP